MAFDHGLNAKVPGQSLTMAPGSLPMEKPPLLTDPRKAAEYFWDKLHSDPKHIAKLVVMLRKGVPVEYMARTILFTAIIHGIIQINTALIVAKPLAKMIVAIGVLKGVKNLKIKNPDMDFANFVAANKEHMYDESPLRLNPKSEEGSPITSGILAGMI